MRTEGLREEIGTHRLPSFEVVGRLNVLEYGWNERQKIIGQK